MQEKNKCHLIQVISSNHSDNIVEINFIDSGIKMPIAKDILSQKINSGFYQLVKAAS